jgi:hypothetical protein
MLWGVRHRNQTRRRKRLLKKAVTEFNTQNPTLLMRWNRRPESMLTMERRQAEASPIPPDNAVHMAMAQAELVGDLLVHVEPAPAGGGPPADAMATRGGVSPGVGHHSMV